MKKEKEKAIEIFNKFYIICQEYTEEIQCSLQAKQCALITVDEMINAQRACYTKLEPYYIISNEYKYLMDVKQEIEKL